MKLEPHLSIEDPRSGRVAVSTGDPGATAFDATLAPEGDTVTDPVGPRAATSTAGANLRTTVLPRVEIIGSEPTLVVDNKRRFEHVRHLGEGGVGEVVGVHDHDIGRQVALKRLRADVQSQATLVRFVEEIRTVGHLEHPNIVPIHDVGVDEHGEYYFVMKYVDGETLETVIEKLAAGDPEYHRRYSFERRTRIFTDVLDAIAFAHEKGIVHRDIKPANVMVGRHGEVLVMDWGIARTLRAPDMAALLEPHAPEAGEPADADPHPPSRQRIFKTQTGTLIGTPAYMSPEQARGEQVDERSDVYSLCVLFHELVCLKHYLADKRSLPDVLGGVLFDEVPFAFQVESPYQAAPPADLAWFIRDGVKKDKKDRYPSVAAMLERLRLRAEGKIPVNCPITLWMRATNEASHAVQRHPVFFIRATAGLFVALVALLALAIYAAVG